MGNHPELDWETIETEHFYIHFHKETERSARESAIVAEQIYGPVTSLYQFEPDSKTHIIIKPIVVFHNWSISTPCSDAGSCKGK